jgi:hypothetical protein
MAITGGSLLALWNDHADLDYDFWHTREHVGERLGVPGFRRARRYAGGDGPLPSYFTIYELDDVEVLESAPYRQLLANPTPWSAAMRPGMHNFLRRGCRTVVGAGGGTGGLLAACLFRLAADDAEAAWIVTEAAALQPFSAMSLGRIVASVSQVSFAGDEPEIASGTDAVLLVEGYDERTFRPGLAVLSERLQASGLSNAPLAFTVYRLAFALSAEEWLAMLPVTSGSA